MKNFLCLNLHEYPLTSSVQMKTRESGGEANSDQLDFPRDLELGRKCEEPLAARAAIRGTSSAFVIKKGQTG